MILQEKSPTMREKSRENEFILLQEKVIIFREKKSYYKKSENSHITIKSHFT